MAAVNSVYEWARTPVPVRQSPSPHSATYPDRPIRPLPKRPLRSRLSPEQAGSIVYPPAPPATGPLFSFPYSQSPPFSAGPHRGEGEHPYQHAHPADVHKPAEEEDVDDGYWVDGKRYNAKTGRIDRASMEEMNGSARPRGQSAAHPPPPPGSTTSSADGYESFENTNNKKKRKIPVSGAAGAHSNAVLAEAPGVAVPSSRTDASQFDDPSSGTGQYYGSGTSATSASGTGISGAGRGRYGRNGRVPSERRPLGLSTSGANARANPNAVTRKEWSGGASVDEKEQGIISAAIANAAEYGQNNTTKTNGNVSLLQQEATKQGPKNSQFTFTCESETSNNVVWPEPYTAEDQRRMAARPMHPGQRAPPMTSGKAAYDPPAPPNTAPNPNQAPPQTTQAKPPRPKRPAAMYYAKAERERRRKQEGQNIHNPPAPSDMWICEFCEYEAIFGTRPEALIRSYEIKDRAEQKRMEEKRRLLEKARMRGRRGKKGKKGKGANPNANAAGVDANQGKHTHGDGMEHQASGSGSSAQAVPGGEQDYEEEFFEDDGYEGGGYDETMPPGALPHTPSNPIRNAWNDGGGGQAYAGTMAGPPPIPGSL